MGVKHTFIVVHPIDGELMSTSSRRSSAPLLRSSVQVPMISSTSIVANSVEVDDHDINGSSIERKYSFTSTVVSDDDYGDLSTAGRKPSFISSVDSDDVAAMNDCENGGCHATSSASTEYSSEAGLDSAECALAMGMQSACPRLVNTELSTFTPWDSASFVWPSAAENFHAPVACKGAPEVLATTVVVQPAQPTGWVNMSDVRSVTPFVPMERVDSHTTVMVRCLSEDLRFDAFVQQINSIGWKGLYDFVYMPMNFRGKGHFGYAFVNFCSPMLASTFRHAVATFESTDSHDCLHWVTTWSTCQGLDANVERYRNSPLMHKLVPVDCKPAVFDERGNRITFPEPTKLIPKPRVHTCRSNADDQKHDNDIQELDRQVYGGDDIGASKQRPGRNKKGKQRNWSHATCNLTSDIVNPMIAPHPQGFGIDGGVSKLHASPR